MNSRLSRPLLAIAVSGALFAGGAVVAGPAFADPADGRESSADVRTVLADPAADPAPEVSEPAPVESTPAPEQTPDAPAPDQSSEAAEPEPSTESPAPEQSSESAEPEQSSPAPSDSPVPDPEPLPDTTAPTGKFTLNANSLWIGQSVTLTQGVVTDDRADAADITRTVNWGDGTTSSLVAGQAPIKKKYTKNGRFTVTVTLTDPAGNSSKATTPSNSVAVTTPGKFKLSKTSVWNGQRFTITFTNVPAATTKLTLDWGDGYVTNLRPRNQTVTGFYYHRKNAGLVKGAVTLQATFTNKIGATSPIRVGKVTVAKDTWKPVVKVKKPGSSNRIKSWKTITGTSSDRGSGAPYVYVWATRITGNKVYCTKSNKKWKRIYSEDDFAGCTAIEVKVSRGKWSLKLGGVAKGTFYVDAKTWDWADNASKWSSVKAKITRS